MKVLFLEYPKCTTCRKAKKWLSDNGIEFEDRNISALKPSKEEISDWYKKSGLSLNKLFNTSGQLYRKLEIKDKLSTMSEDEMITLLASDGMLVKRPVIVCTDFILFGFKEDIWKQKLKDRIQQ